MTREEAKQAVEVLKAFADGKKIEISGKYKDNWNLIESTRDNNHFDFDYYDYRVAKEPQYRPFADAEECWNEMLKHQPFGWIKDKYSYYTIASCNDGVVWLPNAVNPYTDKEMFSEFTFADGEPFGIKIE